MKRLPKGMGSVYKLSGNRRRPYTARIQAGRDENGKPIYKYLGYYETAQEAIQALTDYNKNPYDLDNDKVTISDLWEIFRERKFSEISNSGRIGYNAAYAHLTPLHHIPIKEIKTFQMQSLIDNVDRSWETKSRIRTLLHQLFNIAIELDIISKNYVEFVKLGTKPKSEIHSVFSDQEIKKLFDCVFSEEIADTILIMIYTGMRPSELLSIKTENIHLSENYMIGGLKTDAGKNRVIPISKKIMPLIIKRYNPNNELFLNMSYSQYRSKFNSLMSQLGMSHLPHDGRHTFISMADSAGLNPTTIKLIVGHASQDITERVYTHKAISELINSVNVL